MASTNDWYANTILGDSPMAYYRLDETSGLIAHDYVAGLRALAAEAGLDRIPMFGAPERAAAGYLPSGISQAHRFLWHLD